MCGCTLHYICSLVVQQELHVYLGTASGFEFPFDERMSITEYKKSFFLIQNSSGILTAVIWSDLWL